MVEVVEGAPGRMRSWRANRRLGSVLLGRRRPPLRRGAATLDYVLILGVMLPAVAAIIGLGRQIMALVYELLCAIVSWPFM